MKNEHETKTFAVVNNNLEEKKSLLRRLFFAKPCSTYQSADNFFFVKPNVEEIKKKLELLLFILVLVRFVVDVLVVQKSV